MEAAKLLDRKQRKTPITLVSREDLRVNRLWETICKGDAGERTDLRVMEKCLKKPTGMAENLENPRGLGKEVFTERVSHVTVKS